MPAVSKAQQKFMGMVHAAQKGEKPASKEVEKAADNMSDKSAKDFASTKHAGLPGHVKEGDVTTKPEVPTDDDFDGLPSAAIVGVSAEGITDTQSTSAPKPQPTNGILWKATGKVCEGRSMAERVNMYEKKGGGWRMGKTIDETVYTTLKEFYKNEVKPRKEAKELMVKRRLTPETTNESSSSDDANLIRQIVKNLEETNKWLRKQLSVNYKWMTSKDKENVKKSIAVNQTLIVTYKQNLKDLGETILREDDLNQEPGGDVVATNGVQDHEVSMAKASLMSIGKAVQDLMGRLGDTEKDIPGWIQDHITNAENYIVQASKGYYDQQDKKLGNNIPRPENQLTHSNNGK